MDRFPAPRTIRFATFAGDMDMHFSHIISTPLGNFAVFIPDDADVDKPMAIQKLVDPTDEELDIALHFWRNMADEMGCEGFPIWFEREDEDDEDDEYGEDE